MKRFNLLPLTLAATLGMPMLAFAQDVSNVLENITDILNQILPILMILATIGFIWGLLKYIFAGGSEEGVSEAKRFMLWSIIVLFVMVSVWGIVAILQNTLLIPPTPIPSGV